MNEGAALAALRAELEKRVAADRFAGAVLVAKKDKPLFSGAYGLADREKKIPNKLTTRFRIGSMNKMFTAVAVLQLAQAGKIKLTDPIGKYRAGDMAKRRIAQTDCYSYKTRCLPPCEKNARQSIRLESGNWQYRRERQRSFDKLRMTTGERRA